MKINANIQYETEDSPDTLPFCYICLVSIDKICQNDRLVLCDKCYKKVGEMTKDV